MKKIFLSAAVAAFMLASCQNENIVEQGAQQNMQPFTVKVTKGVDSRVSMDGTDAVWSADDELYVYGKKNTCGTLALVEGAGEATATFTGYINGSAADLTDALFGAELKSGEITYNLEKVDVDKIDFPMHGKFVGGTSEIELTNICGLVALNIEGLKTGDVVTLKGKGIAGKGTYKNGEWTAREVATIEVEGAKDKTTFYVPVFATGEEAAAIVTVGVKNGDTFGTSVDIKNGAISTGIPTLKVDNKILKDKDGGTGTDYVYTAEEFGEANVVDAVIDLAADIELVEDEVELERGVRLEGNGNIVSRKDETTNDGAILIAGDNVTIRNVEFSAPMTRYDVLVDGKDVTIEGCTFKTPTVESWNVGKRAITFTKAGGTLKIKNCDIDVCTVGKGYAFNSSENENVDLLVEGGTMKGWMSYGKLKSAKFDGVTFNAKTGVMSGINPYSSTVFEKCIFNSPFTINPGEAPANTHYLNKCDISSYDNVLDLVAYDGDGGGDDLFLVIDAVKHEFKDHSKDTSAEEE